MRTTKTSRGLAAALTVATCVVSTPALASEPPKFSEAYWEHERELGEGKRDRGYSGVGFGLGGAALTTFFIARAVDDPQRYLAFSMVSAIASLSMAGHGISSVIDGKREMEYSEKFASRHREGTATDSTEETAYYIAKERRSTVKLIAFGSVMSLEGALLLANGIVLSARKRRGQDLRGAKIWPSYLLSGLTLPLGAAVIVAKGRRLREIKHLENSELGRGLSATVQPYFHFDRRTGHYDAGAMARWSF